MCSSVKYQLICRYRVDNLVIVITHSHYVPIYYMKTHTLEINRKAIGLHDKTSLSKGWEWSEGWEWSKGVGVE